MVTTVADDNGVERTWVGYNSKTEGKITQSAVMNKPNIPNVEWAIIAHSTQPNLGVI